MYQEIKVKINHEALEALQPLLNAQGVAGYVLEEGKASSSITFYLLQSQNWQERLQKIREAIYNLKQFAIEIEPFSIESQQIDSAQWEKVIKETQAPYQVLPQLSILPPHWVLPVSTNYQIKMRTGLAFGTGHHASTRLCLKLCLAYVIPGSTVLDVGTGSGILAIGAALKNPRRVLAVDLDQEAVLVAKENVALNNLSNIIEVKHSDLLNNVDGKFDLVLVNILLEPVLQVIANIEQVLTKDGYLIIAGILKEQRSQLLNALKRKGLVVLEENSEQEWIGLLAVLKE